LGLIFVAVVLTVTQLARYSRIRSNFPAGMVIAGIPVGGLDTQQAGQRLLTAYTTVPVEIRYRDAIIQIKPGVVGFELNLEAMLTAADQERVRRPFWVGFWDYLWTRIPEPKSVPLISSLSEERLRQYLIDEVALRYDQPATASMPVAGSVNFQTGQPGTLLDIDRAVVLIGDAFRSPSARQVNLSFNRVDPPRPSIDNLKILLEQIVTLAEFDGTLELYLNDLQTGQEVHFAFDQGQITTADIAFTAASTMKIPIMVSTYARVGDNRPAEVDEMLSRMIDFSENDPADVLMEAFINPDSGPLEVTRDLQTLGLNNTFLAGYFYPGAPLLRRFETPANLRTDVNTDPDLYNQTTATDMGSLLEDIYRCSETAGGTFAAVFPGQISQEECRLMVNQLAKNRVGVLLERGMPEGTRIAHKHGWVIETRDGLMHTISDAGIVYTPGGNYVVTVYMYHPVQLLWDPANELVTALSEAIYNYFNQTIP
jgi:beta-lactamase class A